MGTIEMKKPAAHSGWAGDAVLDFSLRSGGKWTRVAGAWNFGLCATRSANPARPGREQRYGSPRVPQITRVPLTEQFSVLLSVFQWEKREQC